MSDIEQLQDGETDNRRILGYIPELDGLRALAIISVMFHHYAEGSFFLRQFWGWGWIGVRLFFVLSGFLITGILLRCRERIESGELEPRAAFRSFYGRRFLRIFPVYYLYVLAVTAALAVLEGKDFGQLPWYLLYLQNFLFFSQNDFVTGYAQLWTLAIEEQFYLVWPFFILLVPRRRLLQVVYLAIAIGPFSRLLFVVLGFSAFQTMLLPTSNLDTLGIGALLALTLVPPKSHPIAKEWPARCLPLGLGLLAFFLISKHGFGLLRIPREPSSFHQTLMFLAADLGAALLLVYIVDRAARGEPGRWGRFLCCAPLRIIGKLSYALYLFHQAIFHVVKVTFPDLAPLSTALLASVCSVAAAQASWTFLEAPFLRLKSRFPY